MYQITMQSQTTYQTKTKSVASEMEANNFCTRAINTASAVVYDDEFDGMDHGLIRALRLRGAKGENEYVVTVHMF
jgi:hypothetical protein